MISYNEYADIRDNYNLKDADVARIAKITPSTFTDWKSGRSCPKIEKLSKIAAALKEPIESFIS